MAIKYTVLKSEEDNKLDLKIKPKGNINVFLAETKGACINLIGKYIYRFGNTGEVPPEDNPGTGGNLNIITTNDFTAPSDENVYSALRSREEFAKRKEREFFLERVSFEKEVDIKGLEVLYQGFTTPNFNDYAGQITGAQLTAAGMLTVSGLKAMSFEIFELIYNVIRAQGGKAVFSNAANIESCKYKMSDGSLITPAEYYSPSSNYSIDQISSVYLTLKKEDYNKGAIPFKNGDIIYGHVNKIGESGQYAVKGQCIMHVIQDNDTIGLNGSMTIEAALYPIDNNSLLPTDSGYFEVVGSNIPPTEGMAVAQRGNNNNAEGRTTSFFVDTNEGNIIMFQNVTTPRIKTSYYGVVLGKLPEDLFAKLPASLPIKKHDPVAFAKYGIFENVIHLDKSHQIIQAERNRGTWSSYIASSENYEERYKNTDTYYDTVTYDGQLWKCIKSDVETSPDQGEGWLLLVAKGDDGTSIRIKGHSDSALLLPIPPEDESDCYVVDGDLYVWIPETNSWQNVGKFQGDPGKTQYLHIAYANKDSQGNIIDFSTTDSTGRTYIGTYSDFNIDDPNTPSLYTWMYNKGEQGDNGPFQSIVFRRSSTPITEAPTGGDYYNPTPNGWSDGIPEGTDPIYSSSCTFYVDGNSSGWSKPQLMADSAYLEVMYSSEFIAPAIPENFDNSENWWKLANANKWYDDASEVTDPKWMATNNKGVGETSWKGWIVTQIKGEKGDSPIYADLDNEIDNIGLTFDGLADNDYTLETNVGLWIGTTPIELSNLTAISSTELIKVRTDKSTGKVTCKVTKGSKIPERSVITITLEGEGERRTLSFNIVGVKAGKEGEKATLYDLYPSSSQIVRKKDGTYEPSTISVEALKTKDGVSEAVTTGIKYKINNGLEVDYTGSINSSLVTKNIQFILYVDGVLADKETVSLIKDGEDGISPYYADLDNEMDSVGLTAEGKTDKSYTLETNVSMWHGTNKVTLSSLKGVSSSSNIKVTEDISSGKITCTIESGVDIEERNTVSITAVGNGETRVLNYTIAGIKAGAKGSHAELYRIHVSSSQILKKKDGSINPTSISASAQKIVNGVVTDNPSEASIRYYIDSSSISTNYTKEINTKSITSKIKFELLVNGKIMDVETVSVVEDGTDGISIIGVTSYYFISNDKDNHPESTDSWAESIIPPTKEKPYLWMYQSISYSNGGSTTTDPIIIATYSGKGGILNIETQWATTAGPDDDPTNWRDDPYKLDNNDNKYQWTRTITHYTNGDSDTSEPVIVGAHGTDAQPTYWLYTGVSSIHVNKDGTLDTTAINVSVFKSDSSGIEELTTQEELDNEGLEVQYSIDTTAPRTRFELVDNGTIALEDGGSLLGESDDQETSLYSESEALPLEDVKYYLMLWLYDTKANKDIDSLKIDKTRDGVDSEILDIDYGTSESDIIMPKTWYSDKPHVPQGWYLWTRITYTGPKFTYSTSYNGRDGNDGKPINIESEVSSLSIDTGEVVSSDGTSDVRVVKSLNRTFVMTCLYNNTPTVPERVIVTPSDRAFLTYDLYLAELTIRLSILAGTLASNIPSSINVTMTVKDGDTTVTATKDVPILQSKRGLDGKQGEPGPAYMPSGTWNKTDAENGKYDLKEGAKIIPIVFYKANENEEGEYYVHGGDNDIIKKRALAPNKEGSGWEWATSQSFLLADLLMANFAKLGSEYGAIFYAKYLFSQYGKPANENSLGGSVHYSEYLDDMFDDMQTDNPTLNGNFVPNLFLDFLGGAAKFGRLSEAFTKIKFKTYTSDTQESRLIPPRYDISLDACHNVSVNPILNNEDGTCIIVMPKTVEKEKRYIVDGTHSTIIHEYNPQYSMNPFSRGYVNCIVAVCADSALLEPPSNPSFEEIMTGEHTDGDTEPNLMNGWFIWRGYRTKFIFLTPGTMLKLRSCILEDGGLVWFVENSSDFEILDAKMEMYSSIKSEKALFDFACKKEGHAVEALWRSPVILGPPTLNIVSKADTDYDDGITTWWTWSASGDINAFGNYDGSYLREKNTMS